MSKPFYTQKRVIIPVIIVALLIIVAISTPPKVPAPSVPNQNGNTPTQTKPQKEVETKTIYKLGENYDKKGQMVKIASVDRNVKCGYSPDDSLEFVKINIELENKSDKSMSYNSMFEWKLMDATGDSKSPAYCADLDSKAGKLNSGELAVNGKKSAFLVFSVPKASNPLTALYKGSMISNDTIQFVLE